MKEITYKFKVGDSQHEIPANEFESMEEVSKVLKLPLLSGERHLQTRPFIIFPEGNDFPVGELRHLDVYVWPGNAVFVFGPFEK